MTGLKGLLASVRAARDEMETAEREAKRKQGAYHAAIGELARAGLTVREIGKQLGFSHQRVQQILSATACSFCGQPRHAVVKSAGSQPGGRPGRARRPPASASFICDQCIERASRAIRTGRSVDDGDRAMSLLPRASTDPCQFCGCRLGDRGSGLKKIDRIAAHGDGRICRQCVALCADIVEEEWKKSRKGR